MVFGKIVKRPIPAETIKTYKDVMNRKGEDRFADMGEENEHLLDQFFEFELRFQYKEILERMLNRTRGILIGNIIFDDGVIQPPSIEGYSLYIEDDIRVISDASKTMLFIKFNAKAFNYLNSLVGVDYVQLDVLIRDTRNGSSRKLSEIPDDDLDESLLPYYAVSAFGLKPVDYDTVYPN